MSFCDAKSPDDSFSLLSSLLTFSYWTCTLCPLSKRFSNLVASPYLQLIVTAAPNAARLANSVVSITIRRASK